MVRDIMEFDSLKNEEIGARAAKIRMERGLKSKEAAIRMGITDEHYSRLEAGTNRWTLNTVYKLSQILEVPMDVLMNGDDGFAYAAKMMMLFKDRQNSQIEKVIEVAEIILR